MNLDSETKLVEAARNGRKMFQATGCTQCHSGPFYADGLRLSFSDMGNPHERGCRFEGDEGWVHVDRGGIKADPPSLLKVALRPGELRLHKSKHHQGDFIDSIKTRRDPVAPVEAGHLASMFGLISEVAGRTGRKLDWDPTAERFIDDDANRLLARPLRAPWTL